MSRKFIATILAGALAVTGLTAAPARADGNDVAKALAGIAAVAIIAKALDDDRKDKARRHAPARAHSVRPDRHRGHVAPRPLPHRVARKQLPGHCMVRVQTRHGVQNAFGQNCLQRSSRHATRLPRACAMPTRGRGHNRTFYDAGCLRSYGYSMSRR
ncbi:hypothetical protein SAMN05216196_103263 [Lutimaribacter pacificus]|uniref:Uncharacterized protein n=1 Tax=Lutimaribacter pacificus TaxID=391948 RepID=A0A1H0GKP4_9RHOB|nr:hypothetical protein [Lutimaribacter pacificus]SDO07261.1 hypothetical protein SAMN05216196_103263 [Lutimaribacter pacificus]SHJ88956.1 hypothetical protein SAMN05444142_102264 [Lutimaribacter pacificus]